MIKLTEQEYLDIRNHGFVRVAAVSPVVHLADPQKNADEIIQWTTAAYVNGAQVIVFPELCLRGYSVLDLHQDDTLQEASTYALKRICNETATWNCVIIVGDAFLIEDTLLNCAIVIHQGNILGIVPKSYLPDYREFRETRWFGTARHSYATEIGLFDQEIPVGTDLLFHASGIPELVIGIEVCEDGWVPIPPSRVAALNGATLLINISGSPLTVGKEFYRRGLMEQSGSMIAGYVYAAAGFGESVQQVYYDGQAIIADRGSIIAENEPFSPKGSMTMGDVHIHAIVKDRSMTGSFRENAMDFAQNYRRIEIPGSLGPTKNVTHMHRFQRYFDAAPFVPKTDYGLERLFCQQVMALYARVKFLRSKGLAKKLVIGVSGGIDSGYTLAGMVRMIDLFGNELEMTRADIIAITMPGFGTPPDAKNDAIELCDAFGVTLLHRDIRDLAQAVLNSIGKPKLPQQVPTDVKELDLAFENLQAWTRKLIELVTSAIEGAVVIGSTTLSEFLIGWTTLFGDSASHYAFSIGLAKSAEPEILQWQARTIYATESRIAAILIKTSQAIPSPHLLPLGKGGEVVQKSEEINGPDIVRDFYAYWFLRFKLKPTTIVRMAEQAYEGRYTRTQLVKWFHRFVSRVIENQHKRNENSIDGVKLGSVAASAHDDLKLPSDASPAIWLEQLATIPIIG